MMKNWLLLFSVILLLLTAACRTQKNTTATVDIQKGKRGRSTADNYLQRLLQPHFDSLFQNNDSWHIKVIYSQIDRNSKNEPQLTHFYFNADPAQYFYPASTVKLPAALLSLQRINELRLPGLDKYTTMITQASAPGETPVFNDPSSEDGRPSIAHYIKKILLVSDNDAYNRLYGFLGQEYLNKTLHRMGYDSVQLLHRLQISRTEEQNRRTNPVTFFDTAGNAIYRQPASVSRLTYQPRQTFMGKGFYADGRLVHQPFDFSAKNRFALTDLHSILQSVIFPETVPAKQRFTLTEDDYRFLYRHMSMLPRESVFPKYDAHYTDGYAKFLLFGGDGTINNPSLRIFNKVGDAYGFLTDVAYVVDFEKGVEFLLSATIYCNSDGIFNDDKYDYENIGFPFLKKLGEVIFHHELQRTKKHLPDLSKFRAGH